MRIGLLRTSTIPGASAAICALTALTLGCTPEAPVVEPVKELDGMDAVDKGGTKKVAGAEGQKNAADAGAPDDIGRKGADAGEKPVVAEAEPQHPCEMEHPIELWLRRGRTVTTPYGFKIRYKGGGHKILKDSHGGRGGDASFWEIAVRHENRGDSVRKNTGNWRRARNFQGFCWRGVGMAGWHASSVKVEVSPMCTPEGELSKKGCKGAFDTP